MGEFIGYPLDNSSILVQNNRVRHLLPQKVVHQNATLDSCTFYELNNTEVPASKMRHRAKNITV